MYTQRRSSITYAVLLGVCHDSHASENPGALANVLLLKCRQVLMQRCAAFPALDTTLEIPAAQRDWHVHHVL
jgi:hypothetical protein